MAAQLKSEGKLLADAMEDIYKKYGYYKEGVVNIVMKGVDGVRLRNEKMSSLRENAPAEIGGLKVLECVDYSNGAKGLPASNVLMFELEKNAWLCVRPSGTEPKLKIYAGVCEETDEAACKAIDEIIADARKLME